MLLLWWCPFKIQKEKQAGLQFTSTDYLSIVSTLVRIRWTIPLRVQFYFKATYVFLRGIYNRSIASMVIWSNLKYWSNIIKFPARYLVYIRFTSGRCLLLGLYSERHLVWIPGTIWFTYRAIFGLHYMLGALCIIWFISRSFIVFIPGIICSIFSNIWCIFWAQLGLYSLSFWVIFQVLISLYLGRYLALFCELLGLHPLPPEPFLLYSKCYLVYDRTLLDLYPR
jgi:hypothetical protein